MSLCYPGARGETQSELKSLLCLDLLSNDEIYEQAEKLHSNLNELATEDIALEMANKIFVKQDYELKKEYTDILNNYFKTDIQPLDYNSPSNAAKTINSWVSQKTNNKIENLINPAIIDAHTRIILVNAIYFKGTWENQFDKVNTSKQPFTLESGNKVDVDMMKLNGKKFRYLENPAGLNACVCELPYTDHNVSMTIILPNGNGSLSDLEQNLDNNKISEILTTATRSVQVNLSLPKFKLDFKSEVRFQKCVYTVVKMTHTKWSYDVR
jgi:serpin B